MPTTYTLADLLADVDAGLIRRGHDWEYHHRETGLMLSDDVYAAERAGLLVLHIDGTVTLAKPPAAPVPVPAFSDGAR